MPNIPTYRQLDRILKIHPYDTPFILKINVEANKSYAVWVYNETKILP